MKRLLLATLLASLAPLATAQRITAVPTHVASAGQPSAASPGINFAKIRSDFAHFRNFRRSGPYQSLFSPYGFFPDSYSDSSYPGNPSSLSESPAAQPALLMQALSALTANQQLSANQQSSSSDSHSLLIELQGNSYVSLPNEQAPADALALAIVPQSSKSSLRRDMPEESTAAGELPPVTLLFRDGHREEVRDYTIADGVIYARGDFYNDGYWNKKIELSALDLRETVKSNETRGVRFVLPTAPNEVIARP